MLLPEGPQGHHYSPVRILHNHAAAAAGDQLAELPRHGRFRAAWKIRRTHDDRRMFTSSLDHFVDLPAQRAPLRGLVADTNQAASHGIGGVTLNLNHPTIGLYLEALARKNLI